MGTGQRITLNFNLLGYMERMLSRLIFLNPLIFFMLDCSAQCGYDLSVHTSKDYCIGSALSVSASHSMETIVWYKDGQSVDSVKANQYLSPNGILVAGGKGVGGNDAQTLFVWAIFVDEAGNLYVSDGDHCCVKKYTPGGGAGIIVAGGSDGSGPGQLNTPGAVFVDKAGNVYVVDGSNQRIQKWAPGASTGTTVGTLTLGTKGGLYVDCLGNIFMADPEANAVLEFTPGGPMTGVVVAGGNGLGSAPNQLGDPAGLWLDGAGNIFVSDMYGRVQEWAPGASSGITIAGGNGIGYAANQLGNLVWVDGRDTMYTEDQASPDNNSRVAKWARGAASGLTILGNNGPGNGANQFGDGPNGMGMDAKGDIFIGDPENYRVLEFKRTSSIDSTFAPTAAGKYWAVVTDMQGYSQTTDTIYINSPQAGTPSISITATATSTPVCTPITFTATIANAGADPSLQWEVSRVKVGSDTPAYSYNLFANGDQVDCILTAQDGCTAGVVTDTSNIITLAIDPHGTATVTIAADPDTVCKGDPVNFIANVINGAAQPTFQWLVNGDSVAGDDSAAYHTDSLPSGAIVTCLITSDDACGLAKSNSIPVVVNTPAAIAPNQIFTIQYGKSLTLEPVVSGSVTSWLWEPGTGLSDSTIENPVADPAATILYTLKVMTAGCGADSGTILVDVYTPLGLPNAFTPNGDGHDDVFYVLGGPINSRVEEFAVFNRWGVAVFSAHDAAPGDRAAGWNGYVGGKPAPTGTYVYIVVMKYADGSRQSYKGTVTLIR
jgi:gliding motility-associated-like protein